MSDTTKASKIERTPEQKAEEKRIREMHRQNPVREVRLCFPDFMERLRIEENAFPHYNVRKRDRYF